MSGKEGKQSPLRKSRVRVVGNGPMSGFGQLCRESCVALHHQPLPHTLSSFPFLEFECPINMFSLSPPSLLSSLALSPPPPLSIPPSLSPILPPTLGAEPFILWDNPCLEGTRSFGLEKRARRYTPARQRLAYTKSHCANLPRPNPNAPNPRWTSDASRPEISATFHSSWVCSAHVDWIPRSVRMD